MIFAVQNQNSNDPELEDIAEMGGDKRRKRSSWQSDLMIGEEKQTTQIPSFIAHDAVCSYLLLSSHTACSRIVLCQCSY